MLTAENEDLTLEQEATIANHNTLTTRVMQLEAQLTQTFTLATTITNPSPAGCIGYTDPQQFTRENCGKLRSFVALLRLYLIDRPREFLSEQSKL
jgi:hypothetical protein